MNPILVIGLFVAIVLIWLLCSFLFKPIGYIFARLFKEAQKEMMESEESKEKENEK